MSNLFNLPFSFSTNPQTVKNLLQHRLHIQPNSNDDKWSEKAIRGLIKRLTKSSMIDDLQLALDTKNPHTRCVTIPRDAQSKLVEPNPSTTVRKAFNDITPTIAFCRIWRWPDLNTHLELRPTPTCTYAFQHEKDQICVNPYHYERVIAPFIPPIHVPVSDRAVFDSTTSDRFQPDSTVAMDCLSPTSDQPRTVVNSPASVQDNFEAMTPTPATVNNNVPTTAISYVETPFWCSILYYELNQRVGETFHASLNSLVIDSFCDPNASDRFCLGSLTNVNRTPESEACRRMIGQGVRLYYIGGEVFAECLSDSPVFVQSPCCNQRFQWHPATVCKIPPRCNLKIFNNTEFAQMLRDTIQHGYEAVYNLTRICSIRMSFVKGWGEEYRRRTIMSTPCWVEIHLNGPMQWLDNVLQQLPLPGPMSSK
ncbi:unnamed protein product [Adineta ricciae]|uniref:Mothers against decapentaplegic homolog n=1 Tax=Adineta ricciae TaxID=249248 RepID=A0A814DJN5_ADIRI|nr:unnamed protein product [Adineta ricciae]CAF1386788.1 unnamed protein product [Adineta ricciae]